MNQPEVNEPKRDPYRSVVLVLLAATILGTVGAIEGVTELGSPMLLALAITLGISSCVLAGVLIAQTIRSRPPERTPDGLSGGPDEETAPTEPKAWQWRAVVARSRERLQHWFLDSGELELFRLGIGRVGLLMLAFLAVTGVSGYPPDLLQAGIAAGCCLIGAALAATAARYLGGINPIDFPESTTLQKGARSLAWILGLAAATMLLAWQNWRELVQILSLLVFLVDALFCWGLLTLKRDDRDPAVFPLDVGILTVLGERTNIFASILDAAEKQLGIDLRSTWALTVIRRSLEPLVLCLALIAWLSTSLTVIKVEEQGLVERMGVPVGGQALMAGLHVHWPWPVDKVLRIPVRRIQVLEVGHEGTEAPGPEDVLWAVEHAPNEFTLLLGNGRDLITVDAGVQFRIRDAAAWRYHCQNPTEALSAIAYRAVMRNTVNLTLSDALSQNVALLTERMRAMIQREADALDLGVEILGFTVGGMHPPVAVAKDYQAVVSAELRKVTTVVNAQVYRARVLPEAETFALTQSNKARAEGAEARGKAAGEAWSFRALEAQYRAAPSLYFFRRRMETLEKGLSGREFTILDFRIQRDGGEIWVTP